MDSLDSLVSQVESSDYTPEQKKALTSWLETISSAISSLDYTDASLFSLVEMVVSPPPDVTDILISPYGETTQRYAPLIDKIIETLKSITDVVANTITTEEKKTEEHTPEPGVDPQPFVGHHLLADFYGCKGDLEDEDKLKEAISLAIEAADMDEVKTTLVHFKPYGITALSVISQSAVGIHTWPESGNMLVDAVTCGPHDPSLIIDTLKKIYQPDKVDEMKIERGEGGDMGKKQEQDVAPEPVRYPNSKTNVSGKGVEVKPCEHGHGVFATQDFGESELIASFSGKFQKEGEGPEQELKALRVDDLLWIEPKVQGEEVWAIFLDHSFEPNAKFTNMDFEGGTGDLVVVKPIKSGDEILINYGEFAPEKDAKPLYSVHD